jgi:hypothetical protein
MSQTLRIVSVDSGRVLGSVTLTDGGMLSFSDPDTEQMFRGPQAAHDWTEQQAFDWYAQGWSNGYVRIIPVTSPALSDPTPRDIASILRGSPTLPGAGSGLRP